MTSEYEGFFDLGFTAQAVVPQSVVYLDTYFKGEISQGTNSDIESDDEQLNPRKRKASFSGRENDIEAGISYAVSGSSAPPLKRCRLIVNLEDLAIDQWMTIEEFREIMLEHNASVKRRKEGR